MAPIRRTTAFDWLAAASAVMTAGVLRFAYLHQIHDIPFFNALIVDAEAFDRWAQQLAAGDWIGEGVFYQAPLYPYFLGVLQRLLGRDLWDIRVVQIILGSLACGLLYFAARNFVARSAALLAALMLAAYPPAIFFDALVQKAVLAGFLSTLLLWVMARFQRAPRLSTGIAGGVVVGLLSLCWENALLLAVVLPSWMIVSAGEKRRAAMLAAGCVLGVVVALSPVVARNWVVGGEIALTTSNAGTNFYIGNHAGASGTYEPLRPGRSDPKVERTDATELAEEASGHRLTPGEVSRYWFGRAFAFIRAEPAAWLRLMGRKWQLLWNRDEIPDAEDLYVYTRWSPLLRSLMTVWDFGVLFPLAAAGIVLTWSDRRMRLLHLLLATMALSVATFFVFARYRFPMIPVLTIFAAAALVQTMALLRRRRFRLVAVALAVALVAGAVARMSMYSPEYLQARQSFGHVNLGLALDRLQRTDEAIAEYRAAIVLQPVNLDARQRLAPLLAERGDVDEAMEQYRAVLAAEPARADVRNDFGTLLWHSGRIPEAIEEFRAAIRVQPRLSDAHANLCALLLNGGSFDEAVDHCQQALAANPANVHAHNSLGVALIRRGRVQEAIERFAEAVRLDPSYAMARDNLARARALAPGSAP